MRGNRTVTVDWSARPGDRCGTCGDVITTKPVETFDCVLNRVRIFVPHCPTCEQPASSVGGRELSALEPEK